MYVGGENLLARGNNFEDLVQITCLVSCSTIAKHCNHARNDKKILVARYDDSEAAYYCSSLSSGQPLQKLGYFSRFEERKNVILCCCDGLALLLCGDGGFFVWNPSINELIQIPNALFYRDDSLAFVRGAFHWISNDNLHKKFMLLFNISSEVYAEMSLPNGICNIPNMIYIKRGVSVIQGMLYAFLSYG